MGEFSGTSIPPVTLYYGGTSQGQCGGGPSKTCAAKNGFKPEDIKAL